MSNISKHRSWETQHDEVAWEAQLAKLKKYKRVHGDCGVPPKWPEDPGLGTWVWHQRVAKKKLDRGPTAPSGRAYPWAGITAGRVAKLERLQFTWIEVRAGAPWHL